MECVVFVIICTFFVKISDFLPPLGAVPSDVSELFAPPIVEPPNGGDETLKSFAITAVSGSSDA